MTTKLFAVLLLALALAACDSSSTTEGTNANRTVDHPAPASPNPSEQATPAPASRQSTAQFKAGDKAKVNANGASSDATVVSVDEKVRKATVTLASGAEK